LPLATNNEENTAWHLAALEDSTVALQKVWDLAKNNLTTEEIKNKLLLFNNFEGNNAYHLAAHCGKEFLLQSNSIVLNYILQPKSLERF
jgi:hypothetical protein